VEPGFGEEEVARLAALAGLPVPQEDLRPLTEALSDYADFVQPLLRAELPAGDTMLRFDPRWRD
jgi:hypothetical protein